MFLNPQVVLLLLYTVATPVAGLRTRGGHDTGPGKLHSNGSSNTSFFNTSLSNITRPFNLIAASRAVERALFPRQAATPEPIPEKPNIVMATSIPDRLAGEFDKPREVPEIKDTHVAFRNKRSRGLGIFHLKATVPCLFIGALLLQLTFAYNLHLNENLQCYTYHIIGLALSVFAALMLFNSANSFIRVTCLSESPSNVLEILMTLIQVLAWFLVFQGTAAAMTGAMRGSAELPLLRDIQVASQREELQEKWFRRRIKIKGCCSITTNLTGFAAIVFWEAVQRSWLFGQTFWTAILVVPLAFAAFKLLYEAADWARFQLAVRGDGKISHCDILWDMVSLDAELDTITLVISFLSVQAVQLQFLGVFPSLWGSSGTGEVQLADWRRDGWCLMAVSAITALATCILFRREAERSAERSNGEVVRNEILLAINYLSMTCTWAFFFGAKAGLRHYFPVADVDGLALKTLLALCVSVSTFFLALILETMGNSSLPGTSTRRALTKLIVAKGVPIGLSWASCFQHVVTSISEQSGQWEAFSNLSLSVCLFMAAIPAYLNCLLPEAERRLATLETKDSNNLVEDLSPTKEVASRLRLLRRMNSV